MLRVIAAAEWMRIAASSRRAKKIHFQRYNEVDMEAVRLTSPDFP